MTELHPPRARATDPGTSHDAARSVSGLREKQQAVLNCFKDFGPMTHEELVYRYTHVAAGLPKQSQSGLRTRVSELVKLGKIADSGSRCRLSTGRFGTIWQVTTLPPHPTTTPIPPLLLEATGVTPEGLIDTKVEGASL